ncbi:hypothetical protein D9758_005465 [Tetrapyrgos nigripes]|uniref:Cryptic loci regulator 2 N-terminal domain-containing protein n=1 Tax=Tetrapyrgos nigripes TaxID=182062 RepID=A0A8H5GI86_9AGAR|nr:hypothetical protein D9758_005465 [Tetrapyrgos nigripes]
MPVVAELPENPTFKDFHTSDGNKNWPTNNNRVVDENGNFDYHEAVELDDPENLRWRVQLGKQLQKALSWPDGANYVLRDFPEGYKLFRHHKGTAKSHRSDRYLFGSKYSPRFRSLPEFVPHAIWLFKQLPSHSSSSSEASSSATILDHIEWDHTTCECKYATKQHVAKKASPRKAKAKDRVSGTQDNAKMKVPDDIGALAVGVKRKGTKTGEMADVDVGMDGKAEGTPDVAAVPVPVSENPSAKPVTTEGDTHRSNDIDTREAVSLPSIAINADGDTTKENGHHVGNDIEMKDASQLDINNVEEKDREDVSSANSSTVVLPSTPLCTSSSIPIASHSLNNSTYVNANANPSIVPEGFADKVEADEDTEPQSHPSHPPPPTTTISPSQRDKIFLPTTKEILFPISDGSSSKWPVYSVTTTIPATTSTPISVPAILASTSISASTPTRKTPVTLTVPTSSTSAGPVPSTSINTTGNAQQAVSGPDPTSTPVQSVSASMSTSTPTPAPASLLATPSASVDTPSNSLRYIYDSSASKTFLENVGNGIVKQLGEKFGFDANAKYILKDLPEGYRLFEASKVGQKRKDKYLIGSKFGKFRSANEFIPHAIWLLESFISLETPPESSSASSSQSQLHDQNQSDPFSIILPPSSSMLPKPTPSSSDPSPQKILDSNLTLWDHSKCHCQYSQGRKGKTTIVNTPTKTPKTLKRQSSKMDKVDGLGSIRVILGVEEMKKSVGTGKGAGSETGDGVGTQGEDEDLEVIEVATTAEEGSGSSVQRDVGAASLKRKGKQRACSPAPSSSARKKARTESSGAGAGAEDGEVYQSNEPELLSLASAINSALGTRQSARKRRAPARFEENVSPATKKARKAHSSNANAAESVNGISLNGAGNGHQVSGQITVDHQYPHARNRLGPTPKGTKNGAAKPKTTGSDHSTPATTPSQGSSIFGPITFTQMTKLAMYSRADFITSEEINNIVAELPVENPMETYFRPGELVFYSLRQPIAGPSQQIQFWPAVVREFGKDYMYNIQLLGLPIKGLLYPVHPTYILPYLATQVSPELLQSILAKDVWNPSSQFRSSKPAEYLKAPFHELAHYYGAALWQARKIFQSWGFGILCAASSSLPKSAVQVQMSGPSPVYYRAIQPTPSHKRFPYLWWGPERLVIGDFIRLKQSRKAFQESTIPNFNQVLPPSGPGEAVAACELALEGCTSSGASGASLRGVVMRVREFFVDEVNLRSDKQAWVIRACGMLYELADIDWTPSEPSSEENGPLPDPPKGYKFRAILPSTSEAVVTMELVAGRYYPGILSHHILETAILSNALNAGLKGLESLWALEGIVPGEGNTMFSRLEDSSASASTKIYQSAVWFGQERKRMKEMQSESDIDWEKVKEDLTRLKNDIESPDYSKGSSSSMPRLHAV